MGALVEVKEYVRPVRIAKKCGCVGSEGADLVSRGAMAGRPERYMYSCSVCYATFYLTEPAVTIQYEVIPQGEEK